MNSNLDHLIPAQIQDLLKSKRTEFRIVLAGYSAQGRWPNVSISVDDNIVYKGKVKAMFDQTFIVDNSKDQCTLVIEYFNKAEHDTVVDGEGNIVENQHVEVKNIFANNVDLVETRLIHKGFGQYKMNLSAEKFQYFIENGHRVEPSTSLGMFENGTWTLNFELPILSFLTQKQQDYVELWENVNSRAILEEIYQRVLICEGLEKDKSVG